MIPTRRPHITAAAAAAGNVSSSALAGAQARQDARRAGSTGTQATGLLALAGAMATLERNNEPLPTLTEVDLERAARAGVSAESYLRALKRTQDRQAERTGRAAPVPRTLALSAIVGDGAQVSQLRAMVLAGATSSSSARGVPRVMR